MKYIIANLKMNLTNDEIIDYVEGLNTEYKNLIIAPSNIYLTKFANHVNTCSQNHYYKESGAYTGEVSASQLKSIGVKYSLVGHSERRSLFGDTDKDVRNKFYSAVENGITPILCVGESIESRKALKTAKVIKKELDYILEGVTSSMDFIIAYEPLWAIGTGLVPTNDEISEITAMIKSHVAEFTSKTIPVVYGGSISSNNVEDILHIDVLDGILIGKAALDYNFINEIITKQ